MKKEIYDELVLLSAAFEKPQTVQRLKIYTEELSKHKSEDVVMAVRKALTEFKFFPSLAELIELIRNKNGTIDEMAVIIANEIIECISRFGLNNMGECRAFLGVDKWGIVERSGGWSNLCSITNAEIPTTRAQIREVARAYLNRTKRETSGAIENINTKPIQIGLSKPNFEGLLK